MYELCVIEGSYGVSVEAKINMESVKMLFLRQAAQYRVRNRIEAVCETTVTGAVALSCGQGDKNFWLHFTVLFYRTWLIQGLNFFLSCYLISSYPYLFDFILLTKRMRNSASSPGKGKGIFSPLQRRGWL
jgi:hypothetical protein